MLIAVIKSGGAGTLTSITDPAGNSWVTDASAFASGPGIYIAHTQVLNAYGSTAHLTLNWSASINNNGMITMEFSGLPSSGFVVDRAGTNSSTTTNTSSVCALSASTTRPADLIITGVAIGGGTSETITSPAGYTRQDTSSITADMDVGYQIASSTGTFNNSWSWTAGAAYAAATVAYLPSSALPNTGRGQFFHFMKV